MSIFLNPGIPPCRRGHKVEDGGLTRQKGGMVSPGEAKGEAKGGREEQIRVLAFTDANPACDAPEHHAYERHFKSSSAALRDAHVRRTHAYVPQPRCADRASAVLASLLRELLLLRHRRGHCPVLRSGPD